MTGDFYYQMIAYGSFAPKRRYCGGARVVPAQALRTGPGANPGVDIR